MNGWVILQSVESATLAGFPCSKILGFELRSLPGCRQNLALEFEEKHGFGKSWGIPPRFSVARLQISKEM
jgi:hypothetical protein